MVDCVTFLRKRNVIPSDGLLVELKEIFVDLDNDGYNLNLDCHDTDPDIYPGAPEGCDQKDNDCDGEVDEDVG